MVSRVRYGLQDGSSPPLVTTLVKKSLDYLRIFSLISVVHLLYTSKKETTYLVGILLDALVGQEVKGNTKSDNFVSNY